MTRVPDRKQLEGRKEDLFWLRVYKHVIHYGGERAVMVGYITKTMRKLEAPASGVAGILKAPPPATHCLQHGPRLLTVVQHPKTAAPLGTECAKP